MFTLHFEQWITDYMVQRIRNELVEQFSLHHLHWPAGNALVYDAYSNVIWSECQLTQLWDSKFCCVSTRKPADIIFFFGSRMADHAGFELRCTIIWTCLPMEVVVYRMQTPCFFQATRTFVTRVLNYLTLLCCFSIIAFLYLFTKIGIWETGKIIFGCEMAEI